jgi:hypothetical protein
METRLFSAGSSLGTPFTLLFVNIGLRDFIYIAKILVLRRGDLVILRAVSIHNLI